MTNTSVYESLYNNMKSKFTVVDDGCEYNLGEYMSKKANARKAGSNLPVARTRSNDNHAITAVFSYVNDKLTVKKAPEKDKTMKAFPFRTSAAAFVSAVVACTFIFSFGIFAMRGATPSTAEAQDNMIEPMIEEIEEIEEIENN